MTGAKKRRSEAARNASACAASSLETLSSMYVCKPSLLSASIQRTSHGSFSFGYARSSSMTRVAALFLVSPSLAALRNRGTRRRTPMRFVRYDESGFHVHTCAVSCSWPSCLRWSLRPWRAEAARPPSVVTHRTIRTSQEAASFARDFLLYVRLQTIFAVRLNTADIAWELLLWVRSLVLHDSRRCPVSWRSPPWLHCETETSYGRGFSLGAVHACN